MKHKISVSLTLNRPLKFLAIMYVYYKQFLQIDNMVDGI